MNADEEKYIIGWDVGSIRSSIRRHYSRSHSSLTMREVGEDRYIITFGSIKGSDEYSLKTLGVTSSRSQGLILVDEDGEFEIKKIKL